MSLQPILGMTSVPIRIGDTNSFRGTESELYLFQKLPVVETLEYDIILEQDFLRNGGVIDCSTGKVSVKVIHQQGRAVLHAPSEESAVQAMDLRQ